jgi:phosphopantothenate synthetase
MQNWSFTRANARSIRQPVLSVLGEQSALVFKEVRELLKEWIAQTEQLFHSKCYTCFANDESHCRSRGAHIVLAKARTLDPEVPTRNWVSEKMNESLYVNRGPNNS